MGSLDLLGKKCCNLSNPRDFYTGVRLPQEALPNNIILFPRFQNTHMLENDFYAHHHRMVLIVALEGSGQVCIDAQSFHLSAGEALAIFPFQFHAYPELSPDFNWLFITFETVEAEGLASPLRSTGPRTLAPFDLALLDEIFDCWFAPVRQPLLAHHVGVLLARLAASQITPAPRNTLSRPELLLKVNDLALAYIGKGPFGIDDLARRLNTSESHLRARFRESTGLSLGQHLRGLRLKKSCHLLRSTSASITEVALGCGFDSVYSFSRAFKTAWGLTPKEYRKGGSPVWHQKSPR